MYSKNRPSYLSYLANVLTDDKGVFSMFYHILVEGVMYPTIFKGFIVNYVSCESRGILE